MKNKKGFTLVELLVVMAIIAILIALVLVAVSIARRASRDTGRKSNLEAVQLATEDYYGSNRKYPASGDVVKSGNGVDVGGNLVTVDAKGLTLVVSTVADPPACDCTGLSKASRNTWDVQYVVDDNADGTAFCLATLLESGSCFILQTAD